MVWKNMVEQDKTQMTVNTVQKRCDLHVR